MGWLIWGLVSLFAVGVAIWLTWQRSQRRSRQPPRRHRRR